MEPKIEPQVSEYLTDPLALAVLFHVTYERLAPNSGYETRKETRIFDPESPNGKLMLATCAQVQKAILAERVPSSPAPRLEFQADRMTETEWSADTWLVLPNGKRDVLGWIPCDSQEEADEKVANLTKLYAEAVPSSPAAPKRTLVQQNLVIAAEIHCAMTDQECIPFEGERYFPALSTQKLERILGFHAPPDESIVVQLLRTELLQYSEEVKHLREQLDSPAAPLDEKELIDKFERAAASADPRMEIWHLLCQIRSGSPAAPTPPQRCGNCDHHSDLHNIHGCTIRIQLEYSKTSVDCPCGWNNLQASDVPCTSSSPCGEIVAKGVCDREAELHEFNRTPIGNTACCLDWHHTHNVCLGCGREEPV